MINEQCAKNFCKEDISKIENYDKAIVDKTQTWHCHHRRETIFSRKDLIEIGEYYYRPAMELIFLTSKEHKSLHLKGNKHHLSKHHSEETKKKIAEKLKGKKLSEETKGKISEVKKGRKLSEETKKKISNSKKGKLSNRKNCILSTKTKRKMSESHKGKHWYNNGIIEFQARECPDGFTRGRLTSLR